MKPAFMSFSTPTLSLNETLTLASELGYEGYEPRAGSGHAHGIEVDTNAEERSAIKAQIDASAIDVGCLAVSCRYADPATVDQNVNDTKAYIDLAGDLGIPRLRVFGGQIPEGIDRDKAIANVAAALTRIAVQASRQGVTICMETHDDWCDPNHVAAIMKTVNSPAIAVNWDILHPVRKCGISIEDSFKILQPWIQHTHVHDGLASPDTLQMLPIGQGDIDHTTALRLLSQNGYAGLLSGEWINWEPYAVHLPRELAALEKILEQV